MNSHDANLEMERRGEALVGLFPSLEASARKHGVPEAMVEDAVGSFVAMMNLRGALNAYDPARGGFAPFVRSYFKHYIKGFIATLNAKRRGGGIAHISYEETFELSGYVDTSAVRPSDALAVGELAGILDSAFQICEACLNAIGPKRFSIHDLADISALGCQLAKREDPLSSHIWSSLDLHEQVALLLWPKSGSATKKSQRTVVKALNRILSTASLWKLVDAPQGSVWPALVHARDEMASGVEAAHVNRIVLESAFPSAFSRHRAKSRPTPLELFRASVSGDAAFAELCWEFGIPVASARVRLWRLEEAITAILAWVIRKSFGPDDEERLLGYLLRIQGLGSCTGDAATAAYCRTKVYGCSET